jgi:hypothetical protein
MPGPYGETSAQHRRTRLLVVTGLVLVAVTTAACGGGGPAAKAARAAPATTSTAPPTTVHIAVSLKRVNAVTTTTAAPTTTVPPTTVPMTTTTLAPVCVPTHYDPTKPVNLCGAPGVTTAELLRATSLVEKTLNDIGRYANVQAAYNDGYRWIDDDMSGPGYRHYVKWSLVNDHDLLDPMHPESLVYHYTGGSLTLVAAMYMLPMRSRFSDIPDVGGPLTQWHVHNNLCFAVNPKDSLQLLAAGKTNTQGQCPKGMTLAGDEPMLHVWIVKNPCGPFASLKGDGGGQLKPGQTRLCGTLHGSTA